jgi:hypothetical protein
VGHAAASVPEISGVIVTVWDAADTNLDNAE